MGIWAEIKHALNSTLGTANFKSLNTLITDHVTSETTGVESHVTTKVSACETNVKSHVTSVAKMLNSTIGTSDFKSLDELVHEGTSLTPSENAYFNIGNISSNRVTFKTGMTEKIAESTEPVMRMKMWTDGGISIGAVVNFGIDSSVSSGSWAISARGGITVYVNGELVKTATATKSSYQVGTTTETVKADNIYFSAGDIIEVKSYLKAQTTSSGTTVQFLCEMDVSKPIVIYANSVATPFDILRAE